MQHLYGNLLACCSVVHLIHYRPMRKGQEKPHSTTETPKCGVIAQCHHLVSSRVWLETQVVNFSPITL